MVYDNIYIYKINSQTINPMGCGCKNKVQGQVQQPVNQPAPQPQNQVQTNGSQTILESVKQTIEKYYQSNKSN
jgi:hypothetical protein